MNHFERWWEPNKIREPNIKNIEILAYAKLNNIELIILKDSNTSKKNYVFINDKVNRYCTLKKGMRKKHYR